MATDWTKSQIQVFLLEATEAMKTLDWETVSQRAQAILALDPNNIDGEALLAASERASRNSASTPTAEPQPILLNLGAMISPHLSQTVATS